MAFEVIQGDCRGVLAGMAEKSVQMCVTSPPYWGLRDYGIEPSVWGGHEACEHDWGDEIVAHANDSNRGSMEWTTGGPPGAKVLGKKPLQGQFCSRCNAWRGTLGLEPTPDLFVQHIVEVFRAVRRVLRDDGILMLNLGDSYAANRSYQVRDNKHTKVGNDMAMTVPCGLKPKDLIGIPWRCALALQADGWWLRSAMPWVKRSAMPESATDRPTSALEYVFMFTKSAHCYFDMEVVRVKAATATIKRDRYSRILENDGPQSVRHDHETQVSSGGRSWRNTDLFYESLKAPFGMIFAGDEPVGLDVTPVGFKAAHFATFSPRLVLPLIRAGTSERGCCPECGKAWRRVVEKVVTKQRPAEGGTQATAARDGKVQIGGNNVGTNSLRDGFREGYTKTIGWEPGCQCVEPGAPDFGDVKVVTHSYPVPVPCVVLDPFAGSGTVGLVAEHLGRDSVLVEMSDSYCDIMRRRIAGGYKSRVPDKEQEWPTLLS